MCCCGKQVVNGQEGYSWDGKSFGVRPIDAPTLQDGDTLLYDEPGRCGGLDSHCYHYRVVRTRGGGLELLVKHGGGEERFYLSSTKTLVGPLAALDSNGRYWMLNAIFHAQSNAERAGRDAEAGKWRLAAAQKLIKTRKYRGSDSVKVWIESAQPRRCPR